MASNRSSFARGHHTRGVAWAALLLGAQGCWLPEIEVASVSDAGVAEPAALETELGQGSPYVDDLPPPVIQDPPGKPQATSDSGSKHFDVDAGTAAAQSLDAGAGDTDSGSEPELDAAQEAAARDAAAPTSTVSEKDGEPDDDEDDNQDAQDEDADDDTDDSLLPIDPSVPSVTLPALSVGSAPLVSSPLPQPTSAPAPTTVPLPSTSPAPTPTPMPTPAPVPTPAPTPSTLPQDCSRSTARCAVGEHCERDKDCGSAVCHQNICVPQVDGCDDGRKNGGEKQEDCGGQCTACSADDEGNDDEGNDDEGNDDEANDDEANDDEANDDEANDDEANDDEETACSDADECLLGICIAGFCVRL